MPEIVSAWVVIAGESVRQPEIKVLYQNLIDQQLKELKKLISAVWDGKTVRNKEVVNLAAVVLAAMEGAFQLSATANEVMPKNYAAETILEIISTATGRLN
jgi:TetR/AcrR family transcriptional repressor of bet genes